MSDHLALTPRRLWQLLVVSVILLALSAGCGYLWGGLLPARCPATWPSCVK